MKRSVFQLASIALVGSILGKGLKFGLNIIIAQGFGSDALGMFAFGMVGVTFCGLISSIGLDQAVQKFLPIYISRGEKGKISGLIIVAHVLPCIIGAIISSLIYIHRGYVMRLFSIREDLLIIFLICVPLFASLTVSSSTTRGFKETKYSALSRDIIQPGILFIFTLISILYIGDVEYLVISYVISLAVGTLSSVYFIHILKNHSFRDNIDVDISGLLRFSIPLTIIAMSGHVFRWSDIIILKLFTSSSEVGWYQAAFQTSIGLTIALQAMNAIIPAYFSELYDKSDIERLEMVFSASTKWVASLSILGGMCILVYTQEVLLLFGTPTPEAIDSLRVLSVAQVITVICGPVGVILLMTGNEKVESINTVIFSILNIILNIILIEEYGIVGAAAATSLSFILFNFVRLLEVYIFVGVFPNKTDYYNVFLSVIGASIVVLLGSALPISGVLRPVTVGILSLISFFGIVYNLGLSQGDKILLDAIK